MLKQYKFLFLIATSLMLLGFCSSANAMTPSLSVTATGSVDDVRINVNGDPSASVLLFYTRTGSGLQFASLGNTNGSGAFSTVVSSATYGIASDSPAYVVTGGLSGPQSASVTWPYFQSTSSNNLTLSQTALLLNIGQTSTITASSSSLYLLSNSSPSIANINFNASQITVQALAYGSTLVKICVVGNTNTANCPTLSVTVQNSGASQLNFSQNNFSIISGQNASVTVTGGSGVYVISNNSNTTSVQSVLNGSVVSLTATNTTGSAAITVCTSDMANCGIINVNATTVNSTTVTFSQTNPVVAMNQSTTVTIYGGTGNNFYVSSNSNPSVVQANINSNILTLIANSTSGSSTISVCAYAGSCSTLVANVSSVAGNSNSISLSQSSVSILAGQNSNITILGGSQPYNVSSDSSNIFNGAINGSILTIYGVNPGSGTANICASVGCTTLSVTITGPNSNSSAPTFSQNNILLNVGQQSTVYISGMGNYYVSSNSSPAVTSQQINGNSIAITAVQSGNTNLNICQNSGGCSPLYITVSAPVSVPVVTPVNTTPSLVFSRYLFLGVTGEDVLQLQKFLVSKGFLTATPNGRYGPATTAAVKKFQASHGLTQLGSVGPSTRAILNQLIGTIQSTGSGIVSTTSLQQQIQALMAQILQMQTAH